MTVSFALTWIISLVGGRLHGLTLGCRSHNLTLAHRQKCGGPLLGLMLLHTARYLPLGHISPVLLPSALTVKSNRSAAAAILIRPSGVLLISFMI